MRSMNFRLLLAASAIALLAAGPAGAAVTGNNVITPQKPTNGTQTFVQGTDAAGTYKTLYVGGANGTKVRAIICDSNDGSAAHVVTVQISTSTSAHCSPQSNCLGGAAVNVPLNSGFANGVPAVNLMSATNWPGLPLDVQGNPYFYLSGNTQTLEVTYATALTASTQISCYAVTEDF